MEAYQMYIGSFVWVVNIIRKNCRYIKIWYNTINLKEIIEPVINYPINVFYNLNFLVLTFLLNSITEQNLPICNTHTQCQYSYKFKIATLCHPVFIQIQVRLPYPVVISISFQALKYLQITFGRITGKIETFE